MPQAKGGAAASAGNGLPSIRTEASNICGAAIVPTQAVIWNPLITSPRRLTITWPSAQHRQPVRISTTPVICPVSDGAPTMVTMPTRALVGIVTIVGAPSLTGQMTGVVLILTGCLCWALGQVMVRRLGDVMSGFQMTAWVGTIAAPQMLLASVLIEGNPLPALAAAPPFAWGTVLYLGVVMTAIGYSAWYFLLSKYPVPMVMPLLLLLPISTILGAVTFLGEHPDPHVLLGGAIVVSGVSAVIVEPAQFRRLFRRSGG